MHRPPFNIDFVSSWASDPPRMFEDVAVPYRMESTLPFFSQIGRQSWRCQLFAACQTSTERIDSDFEQELGSCKGAKASVIARLAKRYMG
jgi:hypothetical protein